MYRGFKVQPDTKGLVWNETQYYEIGLELHTKVKTNIYRTLERFLITTNTLDGTSIQSNWFPELKDYDFFISHSHQNERLAISLAGWLWNKFKLKAFVDSTVWGNSVELLQLIDKKFCFNHETRTYMYEKRNYSTSHVHMMLGAALSKMMANCECLFFLDTPESLNTETVIERTESPWIYFELSTSQLLKGKIPDRLEVQEKTKYLSKAQRTDEAVDFHMKYEANTKHLDSLSVNDQISWVSDHDSKKHALDELYELKPLPIVTKFIS